ncbi:DNA/RNA non-specific endonuclease [Paenibacillus sp. 2TAF8]|uniref:DNA/RNA non-specific endonuclease n=1 Tax=Paenibacillus sp. 2TAF8 TaxID=3233020 RepID=UPI003F9A3A4C
MIKYWEDQQKMGIVSGSHWSSNKQNKTGETASGNGKKASGGTGANSKPVEKPPESKPGLGSASPSKPNAGNAATTSKNNTTSKTNPEKNETPNEVNTWKPSTKKRDKGEPQANTKPPKSPETNKPEENPNKPKDNSKGTEGTGEGVKPPPIVYETVKYGDHFTRKNRKKFLKPNIEYTSPDGYTYRTDSQGRIIECEGALVLGKGDRSEYAQKTVGKGQGRLHDDDGGHLIGAQFKGPKDIDNLVPQNSQINRSGGKWYEMETEWANALKEVPPKKVTVKIEPLYSGSTMRPDSFKITYQIGDKRPVTKRILNQSGG